MYVILSSLNFDVHFCDRIEDAADLVRDIPVVTDKPSFVVRVSPEVLDDGLLKLKKTRHHIPLGGPPALSEERAEHNLSWPTRTNLQCVVFCVFFPSILDIKFVGRTSRGHTGGRSHRIFNPPSFCGACLAFCREKDSAIPFPRRP